MNRITKVILVFFVLWGFFLGVESWIIRKLRGNKSNGFAFDQTHRLDEELGLVPVLDPMGGIYG